MSLRAALSCHRPIVSAAISELRDKIIEGGNINRDEASWLITAEGAALFDLFAAANAIREHFKGDTIDLCSILSARAGGCSEDCAFCAQSSISAAPVGRYPLKTATAVKTAAIEARTNKSKRFCVVTGGRSVSDRDLEKITAMVAAIKEARLSPCATLGFINAEQLTALMDAGLNRYHHNIETSAGFFPNVCTTHSFADKLRTIETVKAAGCSLCSGGIFGMGETWADRLDMALLLRDLDVDSVPINFLTPIDGTKMGGRPTLDPLEALKIIAVYRFILPGKEIRICGGRLQTLGQLNSFIFMAGADGLLIGNYLTTQGRAAVDDLQLIAALGLRYG
ncbi:MAG: biotin synthase BioB [Nitrospirae bacterium]|nr:biotin synthase BioB [Nitrospirota bacterium]